MMYFECILVLEDYLCMQAIDLMAIGTRKFHIHMLN